MASTSDPETTCPGRRVCGRRISALCASAPTGPDVDRAVDCDPAFVIRLADALKPRGQETLGDLRRRAAATARLTSRGGQALAEVAARDSRRADYYKALSWRSARLPLRSLRPWPGMSGLPKDWCHGTVEDTAELIRQEGVPASAQRRLRSLLAMADQHGREETVAWLTSLPLIAVPDAILHDRPAHATALWGLDDGCARSITLSLLGVKAVVVLVGEPARTQARPAAVSSRPE